MNLSSTLEQVLGDHVSNGKNPLVRASLYDTLGFQFACLLASVFHELIDFVVLAWPNFAANCYCT